MLILTMYDYAKRGGKEAIMITDEETGELMTIRLVKRDGNQYKLAFEASKRFRFSRFIEGSEQDPSQNPLINMREIK